HFVAPFVDGQFVTNDEVAESTFDNVTFDVSDVATLMEDGSLPVPAGITAGGSPVADKSGLGWTWAATIGGLDGL
ncbi:MAG: hypothetical protein HRU12_16360, partial [Phaeodactylibacter sp.]|nr:hypothetical protein [Phaeodactylibacter sp.]